jgi:virulence-associated protein VapD
MYAIAFDLDTETLKKAYPNSSYNNAYVDIQNKLVNSHGSAWQQGSVYFGGEKVNAVTFVKMSRSKKLRCVRCVCKFNYRHSPIVHKISKNTRTIRRLTIKFESLTYA